MKTFKFIVSIIVVVMLISCGGSRGKESPNQEGFTDIEKELKSKFGENAFFTDLTITHDEATGNIISVTVTKNPESLKMGEWNSIQGNWVQESEITLEVPKGSKAADFMFQLNNTVSLSKLGELVEKSSKQLTAEKAINDPALSMAFIKFPENGDINKAEYVVMLNPPNGGTTFTFNYKLNGDFIKMDY
ncbi:hypothetical protein MQE36_05730 [Zhouia spongiae]|uniref:DUF3862 domain-containing protein n=1 Tax=Zhouia spongiae TaxID=2202721 RepID=A0ABY3YPS9_9FLAO|nr:hypothetical protein [Zhouia spongiae]UNY99845.1 hypothetical protein MQE36_05730 [Zhouia spongiae]